MILRLKAADFAKVEGKTTYKIPFCKVGKTKHGDRWIDITEKSIVEMMQWFANMQATIADYRLPLNYDHLPTYAPSPDNDIAAGWIVGLSEFDPVEKILYATVTLTEKARKHIEAEEYLYISPEFSLSGWINKETGKEMETARPWGAAITNEPHLEMPSIKEINNLTREKGGEMNELLKALGVTTEAEGVAKIAGINQAMVDATKRISAMEAELAVQRTEMKARNDAEFGKLFDAGVKCLAVTPADRQEWEANYFSDANHQTVNPFIRKQLERMSVKTTTTHTAPQGANGGTDTDQVITFTKAMQLVAKEHNLDMNKQAGEVYKLAAHEYPEAYMMRQAKLGVVPNPSVED